MRLKNYWDLLTIVFFSAFLDLFIFILPENPIRKILGLPFILFFPGYTLISFLFPEEGNLDLIEKIALSFGLSIAVVPLIGLALNYTPLGIRLTPILLSLTLFNVFFGIFAIIRRRNSLNPWIPDISLDKIKDFMEWEKASKIDRILTIVLIIAIIISIATLIYLITAPKQGEKFTEFYILGPKGKAADYPTKIFAGENASIIIGIVNHEYRNVTYFVEIWLVNASYENNQTRIREMYLIDSLNVTLPPKQVNIEGNWTPQWEERYNFSIDKPGKWQMWFLLFKDKKPPLAKINGSNYAGTNATKRIIDAINGKIQSLKLNIEVRKI